ncbi:TraR/DksA family transcriptional regulator [Desulfofustis limnaeus]|uniref:Repressor PtrB n=1 Tax=Desulfofustis limnaeus TaxID=2740163 RepID=A0ABM7W519_9BACT|nr:repressor PtrB [Desulfofustis limnaeus]
MVDLFDRAQEAEERDRKRALKAALRQGQRIGPSALVCSECGEPIPEARRIASPGCTRCITCERAQEDKQRR